MPWPQTGTTQYHALPDKLHAIKGLVVCNNWDLEPLKIINSLALDFYQPSSEALIVPVVIKIQLITLLVNHFPYFAW